MALADPRSGRRDQESSSPKLGNSGALEILPVADKAALDRFIKVPWRIYRDDPQWVPPLVFERRQHLDRKSNPYFSHAEVQFWLALSDGKPVGRISAQIDQASLNQHQDATGHFGFLEATDDGEVFAALLGTAEAWLRQRGMVRVLGPFSLSINDESGLLVEGFDRPPSLMMGHAPPYYGSRLEALGYAKARDLIAYDFDTATDPLPPTARKLIERLEAQAGLTVRPLVKARFDQELKTIMEIFNDAWANNWGFVPFSQVEIAKIAKDLKPLIYPEGVAIAEVEGEPAAFAVALPNLNEAIADLDGALLPFGWAKLLYRLKAGKIKSGRMPLMGVRQKFQGGTLGAALAFAVIGWVHQGMARRGFTGGELSWVLEDNLQARKIIETAGGRPYKTYRVYEKALA